MKRPIATDHSLTGGLDIPPMGEWLARIIAEGVSRAIQGHAHVLGTPENIPDSRNGHELLTASQAAHLLNLPLRRVYELAKSGGLPSVRIGRQVRFRKDALAIWIQHLERDQNPL